MMKRLLMTILIICVFTTVVFAEDEGLIDRVISTQMDTLGADELDNILREVLRDINLSSSGGFKDILKRLVKGEKIFEGKTLVNSISSIFFEELRISLVLLSKILIITLISAILTNLQNTFENSSISELANYITYILIAILVIGSFNQLVTMAKLTIDRMVIFMQVLLPILLTLLVLTGGPNTKIIFHPMILTIVNIIGVMVKNFIFPLISFSFLVSVLSNLSKKVEFGKLSELCRQVITFIISGAFTVFIGIITIYGLSTKIDGLTIRTAKFAVDRFIPIVGGFLSDAVEAVIGSSAILKNGIGMIGLILLMLIILTPLIKVTALLLLYKVIGAIIEPIGSSNVVKFFNDVSKALLLILISMVSVAIMFFITVTIIVDTGNSLLMLR